MSTVRSIAHADLERCYRSRVVLLAGALFVGIVLASWLPWLGSPHAQADDRPLLLALRETVLWLPLFALVLGLAPPPALDRSARSPIGAGGERDSGARDSVDRATAGVEAVLGTLFARLALLGAVCTLLVASLAGLIVLALGTVAPASVAGGLLAVVLYGSAWLGITLGVATGLESRASVVGVVLGCIVLLGFLWHQTAVALVSLLVTGETTPGIEEPVLLASLEEPTWYLYVARVSPFDALEGAIYYLPRTLEALVGGSTTAPHLPNLFGLVVLGLWTIGPVLVARRLGER